MEQIMLEIIDDPANVGVYKGAGHLAATRAESAIRMLESAFPQLHFEINVNHGLSNLKATAIVHSPIDSDEFIGVLTQALETTGTRVAPLRKTAAENLGPAN